MCNLKKQCPVPFDQQPLNEYFELKESIFFSWSINERERYLLTIFYIFVILCILFYPFVLYLFPSIQNIFKFLILDNLLINIVFLFIFLRLYLGWSYVVKRLLSATIFYEESGWYDGQIWIKTVESLMQDRLIGIYEVVPFIKRLKYSFFIAFMFLVLDISLFCLL